MQAITSPATVAVGDQDTAAFENSVKAAIDAIVAREGARATTTAAQAIPATTATTLNNNGGANVWTATEDTGGFVSAVAGTSTPIVIPAGKGGLYIVGAKYVQALSSAGRAFLDVLINGAIANHRFIFTNDGQIDQCCVIPLNAGDTLGLQTFTTTATNASIGSQLYCYRQGN
jgi:hypothetical protein